MRRFFARFQDERSQKGQVLIIVVFAIISLVAVVGLVIDLGVVFINYARLRRAVDAAALAASSQYREVYQPPDMAKAAQEFLTLNGVSDPTATIQVCNPAYPLYHADDLCPTGGKTKRKYVRVLGTSVVHLAFLPVIGIREVTLQATATSEAASVDLALVIDLSESMTFDAPSGDPMRDPRQCNAADPTGVDGFPGECHPFEEVKSAAYNFVDQLYFPYDRVSVITFDRAARVNLHLSDDEWLVKQTIRDLKVFDPAPNQPPDPVTAANAYLGGCGHQPPDMNPNGLCRAYTGTTYVGLDCPIYYTTGDPSSCTTTNIGGGLLDAGNEFVYYKYHPSEGEYREDALWVVVLLTDGAANASTDISGTLQFGFCPPPTHGTPPYCRDASAATRHCADPDTRTRCEAKGGVWDPNNYDADDFARDMADFVGLDQKALTFTIGLGKLVVNAPQGDPDAGEKLLQYAADVGEGIYYFAPSGAQLRDIFAAIANNIATRLTH